MVAFKYFSSRQFKNTLIITIFLIISISVSAQAGTYMPIDSASVRLQYGWQYRLGDSPKNSQGIPIYLLNENENNGWNNIINMKIPVVIPRSISTVWFKIKLPEGDWRTPCIYFENISAQSLEVFIDSRKVYEKERKWLDDRNKIIIPLEQNYRDKTIYIRTVSRIPYGYETSGLGPTSPVYIGSHNDILSIYLKKDLPPIMFGCALALIAIIMLICSPFLNRERRKSWFSLGVLFLVIGILWVIFLCNLDLYFPKLEEFFILLRDTLKFGFGIILVYFIEQLFGPGFKKLIRRLWQFLAVFVVISIGFMYFNAWSQYKYNIIYAPLAGQIIASIYCLLFLILSGTVIYYALKGNIDAKMFSVGFLAFILLIIVDLLIYFFISTEHPFIFWQWGFLVFLFSLIIILIRRITADHKKVLIYSTELENKNQELDAMWKEVTVSRDQLADLNKTLEQRVRERTDQIEKANEELTFVNKELYNANSELKSTLEILQKTQTQLIEAEKMAALGQLVAGVAHEINTPLAVIRSSIVNMSHSLNNILIQLPGFFGSLAQEKQTMFLALLKKSLEENDAHPSLSSTEERSLKEVIAAQLKEHNIQGQTNFADILVTMNIYDIEPFLLLLKDPDNEIILKMAYTLSGLQRSTKTILKAEKRTTKVVFALKSYSHFDYSGQMAMANLREGIETVLTLYQNKIKHGVEVKRNYEEIPPILCYPDELNQVWTNIIDNALQAMDYKGTLTIDISQTSEYVIVAITDTGTGIPGEIQDRIFDPFFTTKPQGCGSGLGLDIVKKIINKHNGKIKIDSVSGKTTFSVYIPALIIDHKK